MTTILTRPQDLKPGMKFDLGGIRSMVVSPCGKGVTVHLLLELMDDVVVPSALHLDDLNRLYKQGVPVIFEPNIVEGTVTIPPHGEPASMTIGQVTSLFWDTVIQEGKAKVGETYKVRFEQMPPAKVSK